MNWKPNMSFQQKAIFFDRDGVINRLVKREDGSFTSPWNIREFEYYPYVIEYFNYVKQHGYLTFIVTNQPGINDGDMSLEEHLEIVSDLYAWLHPNKILYESDRNSPRYKPSNLMLEELIEEYNVDRSKSFMVGDRWKDIVPGKNSKLNTILIGNTEPYFHEVKPDYTVYTFKNACDLIMEIDNGWFRGK